VSLLGPGTGLSFLVLPHVCRCLKTLLPYQSFLGDDLTDYEDDVMANSFNIFRGGWGSI